MSNDIHHESSQRSWFTTAIGWLSLCIVAAAWGHRLLPEDWQNLWGAFGVFGLAAALGLASSAATKKRAASPADQH